MTQDRPKAYSYIRMSTPEQVKGHSRQRQLDLTIEFAAKLGLDLVSDEQLEDLGVSAFKGANVKEGALGRFLQAVEAGTIPKGSYLLVESLDRISRQQLLDAQALFLRIITGGIKLATLQDGRVYSAESPTQLPDLILSLTFMSLAHEESEKKSKRMSASWAARRSSAVTSSQPLTKWCPAWLCLSQDRSRYEIVPKRAAIVRSIFEEAVAGIGIFKIGKRLNERHVPLMGKSNGWHPSYVAKILSNRAVIGEYQPHKLVDGKRKPVGDPIKNYFPRIIEDELFYRAQQSKSERRITGRGRKGAYLANLFSGLATCDYCRGRMTLENKGPPPKGGTFLVCEAAKRGMGCVTTGWRYEQFESSFLAFVEQLDLPNIISNDDSEKKALDDAIQALQGQLITLKAEMDNVWSLMKVNPNIQFVVEKLTTLEHQLKELEQQLEDKKAERKNLDASENAFYESKDEIKTLIDRLRQQGKGDLYKLRSQVASRIKAIVRQLAIAPTGNVPFIKMFRAQNKTVKANLTEEDEQRYFHVTFMDGTILRVYPTKADPLEYEALRHIETHDGSNPSLALD